MVFSTYMRMTSLFRLSRLAILIVSCAAFAAYAQSSCGPNGYNELGLRCDPGAGAGAQQQQQRGADAASPGQTQQLPVISNRPGGVGRPGQPGDMQYPQYPQRSEPGASEREPRDLRPRAPAERNDFESFVLQSLGRELPMFGYNLFQGVPTTFAPLESVPVTSDYVIGPGDEILLRAWGAVDIDYRAVVDRNGSISIPRIGSVAVSGIRYQDLQPLLKNAIGRVFRNFDLNVTMGQLRSMQILVVGHAMRPGTYTVSSLSTLVNALFASGGPTVKGSLRGIQLKRRDKLVTEFDVYDLLLRGDKSKDVSLLPGDVIYIPPIGPLAAVAGSVNNPAIYELKGERSLAQLLELAGGLATTADGQKVSVERIVQRKSRTVEEFTLDQEGMAHAVRDGDLVTVLQLSPRFDNTVTVRGNVAVPARHPWRAGLRVRDVVPDKESLIVPDYWIKRNLIVRPDVTGRQSYGLRGELVPDLRQSGRDSMGGDNGRNAAGDDRQAGAARPDGQRQRNAPGQERGDAAGQQLRTEIKQHLPEVNWDYAVIERLNRNDLTTQLIPFNLGRAILEGDPQNNVVLEPGDVITVFSKVDIQVPVAKQTKFVRLEGEIATPGVYQVLPGETLRQLLVRVGGFTRNAYLYGSELTRESVRLQQQKRLSESLDRFAQEVERNAASQANKSLDPTDAPRALAQAEAQRRLLERLRELRASGRIVLEMKPDAQLQSVPEIALEDGDRFLVPARPSTVSVVGAVYNQNTFVHDQQKRLGEYLGQAGGATRDADSARVYVVRADGTVTARAQGGFFTTFSGERLNPGDTVVVPETLDRFNWTRELKDWSQIFYQFALGVAGLKVLQGL
ncbi:MAG: polysaccharide export protein [Betaproteobacteria bacterium]|nr:polysaccharide export protein [Betaproteobacteria bacterium]